MEQLEFELGAEDRTQAQNRPRVSLPKAVRADLVLRMAEAIVRVVLGPEVENETEEENETESVNDDQFV